MGDKTEGLVIHQMTAGLTPPLPLAVVAAGSPLLPTQRLPTAGVPLPSSGLNKGTAMPGGDREHSESSESAGLHRAMEDAMGKAGPGANRKTEA